MDMTDTSQCHEVGDAKICVVTLGILFVACQVMLFIFLFQQPV